MTAAMLRATTFSDAPDLPAGLEMTGEGLDAEGLAWLAEIWSRPDVRDALGVASPALCRQVAGVLSGQCRDARRTRRVLLSVVSYVQRWRERPTPFGMFAGVAPVRIGTMPRVRWGDRHQMLARADADWLAAVISRLHQCPALVDRLMVVSTQAGQVRGHRYVVPGPPATGQSRSLAPIEVSVRYTRPVATAIDAAWAPIRHADLRALVASRFPRADPARISAMLSGLVAQDVLISSLRAPMTETDALGHLLTVLGKAGAEDLSQVAELVRGLRDIHDEIVRLGAAIRPSDPGRVAGRMTAICDRVAMPLVIDTALDCDVQIPEAVVREAQEAFSVLHRLTPHPFGSRQWISYHARFRARYGAGAVVPVLDLVADSGLGLPAGYLGSGNGQAARPLTARDETIFALIQRAMLDGADEIVLTGQEIADLAAGGDADFVPVPQAELAVEIRASSLGALAAGSFLLAVTGTPSPASSMAGRFAHLLPAADQARLAATYQAADPDVITAQLSFPPRRRRNDNIARAMRMLPCVIALSEYREPGPGIIQLADLAVTADAERFCLVQLSTGRRVEARALHALEATVQTPPLARFLAEIATARSAAYRSFDFGAASGLAYLPRIRYKRTILAPARWLLSADDLPGKAAAMHDWEAGLGRWRARLHVPDRVAIAEHERRLPVDLAHPAHRLLLRSRLAAGRIELREAPSAGDLAWLGRAHELLVPFTLQKPPASTATWFTLPAGSAMAGRSQLPGRSAVLHAQLHGHPVRFDEILTEHLPSAIGALEPAPTWWFRRHKDLVHPDADQYLEICLRLPAPGQYGHYAELICGWATRLRDMRLLSRLAFAPYEPQPGRFGHGLAMDAAEAVFAADSAAAFAQITVTSGSGALVQALAAASMLDIAVTIAGTPRAAARWLASHLPREQGQLDRALRCQALDLADPERNWAALRALPGGEDIAAAWRARAQALSAYRERLAAQRDPLTVLPSLLHHHYVRAASVDPDAERITTRLLRACALSYLARHEP